MKKTPKYRIIYDHYRDLIDSGALQSGEKLPTEDEINRKYGVSHITAISALKQLAADGYVTRIQGSGTYVRAKTLSVFNIMRVVLLIIPFMGKGRESRLIESIERTLGQAGYTLMIKNSHDDDEIEKQIIQEFKDHVSGILLYPSMKLGNIELYRHFFEIDYPIVYLDRYPTMVPCRFVSSDNAQGGTLIGKFMLQRKYERFVLMFHNLQGLTSERDRLNGFMNVLLDNDIPDEHAHAFFYDSGVMLEGISRVADQVVTHLDEGYRTALVTCNDSIAYHMMDEFKQRGINRSDDQLIVAGFDNLNIAPVSIPFVTISQQHGDIGRYSAKMLIRQMEHPRAYFEYRYVPVELHEPIGG